MDEVRGFWPGEFVGMGVLSSCERLMEGFGASVSEVIGCRLGRLRCEEDHNG